MIVSSGFDLPADGDYLRPDTIDPPYDAVDQPLYASERHFDANKKHYIAKDAHHDAFKTQADAIDERPDGVRLALPGLRAFVKAVGGHFHFVGGLIQPVGTLLAPGLASPQASFHILQPAHRQLPAAPLRQQRVAQGREGAGLDAVGHAGLLQFRGLGELGVPFAISGAASPVLRS